MTRRLCTAAFLMLMLLAACNAHQKRSNIRRQGNLKKHPTLLTSKTAKHVNLGRAALLGSRRTKSGASSSPELVTLKAIKVATFYFANDTEEQQLKDSGAYDSKSVLPYDVTADAESRSRLFVTTPPVRRGIPASLSTVPYDEAADAPLTPYPSLELHRTTEDSITDCHSQLVSVISTTKTWMDDDTLYALDSGVLDITTSPNHVCPPKIVAFNLLTDEVKSTTVIENSACNSLYTVIVVEECPADSLVAYTADTLGFRLTVTDLVNGDSKHLQSQYFYPKPGFFFTKAGGPSVFLPYGLCGLSADNNCNGKLYLQAFASDIQDVLDKELIHNSSDGDVLDTKAQLALPGRLSGPNGPVAVDPTGQLVFFSIENDLAVYCWNTSKEHDPKNFRIIAQDDERLQYMSSLKIDRGSQRMYIQSNRFTKYLSNATDYSEDNYYILYIPIDDLQC
ncbi:major royal jelly protein 1-like [Schistocerca nitens]|uniref:major royal jelly protein 1-like n=1 Tax=Schistocerca nitens TaxID=7011 RepID=UPI0021176CC1|nr:major royal jelly protein 1-like [Schistocerca nitens]